jgi:hypothetical protein
MEEKTTVHLETQPDAKGNVPIAMVYLISSYFAWQHLQLQQEI